MDPKTSPKLRVRGMIITGAVAAVTMVGAFYGASLKSQQQAKEVKKRVAVERPEQHHEDELITSLLSRKRALIQAKESWERKAETLRQRMEANSQRSIGGASGRGSGSGQIPPSGK